MLSSHKKELSVKNKGIFGTKKEYMVININFQFNCCISHQENCYMKGTLWF